MSKHTIKHICFKAKNNINPEIPNTGPSFISPHKGYKRAKIVSELDNFNLDIVKRTIHVFYNTVLLYLNVCIFVMIDNYIYYFEVKKSVGLIFLNNMK